MPLSLSPGDTFLDLFKVANLQTVGHGRLYPMSTVRERMSGGNHSSREPPGLPSAGLHLLLQMSRMSSRSDHIQIYHSKLEVGKWSGPFEEIRFRIPRLWFRFGDSDQDEPTPNGERIEE